MQSRLIRTTTTIFLFFFATTTCGVVVSFIPSTLKERHQRNGLLLLSRLRLCERLKGGGGDIIESSDDTRDCNDNRKSSARRRGLLTSAAAVASSVPLLSTLLWTTDSTAGALPRLDLDAVVYRQSQPSSLYALSPLRNTTSSLLRTPLLQGQFPANDELSSELCLLRLLPVKNPFFRELQSTIEGLSALRAGNDPDAFAKTSRFLETTGIPMLDKKRNQLEPVFNPDDNSMMQIYKGERFEILIETLRSRLVDIAVATAECNVTETFRQQKKALLVLSEIGELLVAKYPYNVPTEGLYSYLPRLLGRCTVTFSFRRRKKVLGNVTMIADGYAAPITAGNFVDLCCRGFYTGLPIRFAKKRVGTGPSFDVANLPILGSYGDGFYDPLTAKLRLLPLELIRVDKSSSLPELTYSQGLSSLSESKAVLSPTKNSKPLLSFKIPGLVAMNHPDFNPNGASAEFFSLQKDSMLEERRNFLDGEYAPFGYIIDGYDVFQNLQPNDVIDSTLVSEFGKLSLVKLRRSSFSEVVQGSGDKDEES